MAKVGADNSTDILTVAKAKFFTDDPVEAIYKALTLASIVVRESGLRTTMMIVARLPISSTGACSPLRGRSRFQLITPLEPIIVSTPIRRPGTPISRITNQPMATTGSCKIHPQRMSPRIVRTIRIPNVRTCRRGQSLRPAPPQVIQLITSQVCRSSTLRPIRTWERSPTVSSTSTTGASSGNCGLRQRIPSS